MFYGADLFGTWHIIGVANGDQRRIVLNGGIIHGTNFGMGCGNAHHDAEELSGEVDVIGKLGLTGNFFQTVGANDRFTHNGEGMAHVKS